MKEKMITIKKSKRAMFFTISVIFLIPALITVFTLSGKQVNLEKSFILDRIYDLSNSIESSIKEIFDYYYDSKILIEEGNKINVTFTENISGDKDTWGNEFNNIINNFKSFVESEEQSVKIDISGLEEKETPSIISPYNITYSRSWGTGHVTIKVVPETMNFNSYDIIVNSTNLEEIDNVSTQFRNSGTFSFSVTAADNFGHNIVNQRNVDPSDNHQVQIFFKGGNKVKITLISNNLEIWTNTPSTIIVSTKIDGLEKTDEKVRVSLFRNVVNVSFPSFKVEKIESIDIG